MVPSCAGDRTGQAGELRLRLASRAGRTVVTDQYWRLPLQLMPPSWLDGDDQAFLYLLNPTGGLVAGDRLVSDIVLDPGARALLTTQSATRVYRSSGELAEEVVRVVVGPAAVLEFLPDHTIPFAGARFARHTRLDLDPSSTLVLVESLAAGRLARGERFAFERLRIATEIVVGGDVILADRLHLDPARDRLDRQGLWEGHGYHGVLYCVAPRLGPALADRTARLIEGRADVYGGAGQPAPGIVVARVLARSAESLHSVLFDAWGLLRPSLLGKPARRLRKY